MARFSVILALFAASTAMAAPFDRRLSLSSVFSACNVDRFNIVTTLASTGSAVGKIDTTDPATATAVTAAQAGLTSAGDGIKTIALALVTGGTPPADARDQVKSGLANAQTALSSITDPTANATVADAQGKLAAAISDGNDVVADCT
ncbi:hypothetical protein K438DRAFT_1728277 [Mycena galopus ATCC 62051]|nr:hypothetical protein K438DRAFT_1728277 [Mycena galopus ATCC 62051]